jgi:hypothetical protein
MFRPRKTVIGWEYPRVSFFMKPGTVCYRLFFMEAGIFRVRVFIDMPETGTAMICCSGTAGAQSDLPGAVDMMKTESK